ncbi:MAG: nuclear transport factor 2 family protein [Bacilli bacterium]|nr:nuclear transport factor 2 family protein [Bacilli bacterium]
MLKYNRNNNISSLTSEENIILNRYKEMQQAMVDKDIDKLNKIVKDGTTFTHMSGKTQTKEEYFEDIRTGALDYQSYTIENPSVSIDGNKAILKARVTLTANAYGAQGSYPFNVSAYFEKVDKEWLYTNKY